MANHDPQDAEKNELIAKLKAEVASVVNADASLRAFCANEHTYVRYLLARQWNLQKASKMLHDTLKWRLDYKPHLIRWKDVRHESLTGKQMIYPCNDKEGRPLLLMRPRNENSLGTSKEVTDSKIRLLIFHLEVASRMADESGLDFEGYTYSTAPPLKVSMYCNNVLQNHYPERLGLAANYHAPMLFTMTWKAVAPFIDSLTKSKIIFVDKNKHEKEQMESRFHMEKMEECMGGGHPGFMFNVDEYDPRMAEADAAADRELEAAVKAMQAESNKLGEIAADVHATGVTSMAVTSST
eukprot:gene17381-23683_t